MLKPRERKSARAAAQAEKAKKESAARTPSSNGNTSPRRRTTVNVYTSPSYNYYSDPSSYYPRFYNNYNNNYNPWYYDSGPRYYYNGGSGVAPSSAIANEDSNKDKTSEAEVANSEKNKLGRILMKIQEIVIDVIIIGVVAFIVVQCLIALNFI